MPLFNTAHLLNKAKQNNTCIGAFNIENLDMIKAVITAAEMMNTPAIIQTTYTTVNYAKAYVLKSMVEELASRSTAELSLHLDHGNNIDICLECIKAGYNSVMIDGSHYAIDENITLTKKVVQKAAEYGIAVEGEIGKIGGVEDEVVGTVSYTDVDECKYFAEQTDIDFVAIGVGTSHGIYKGIPNINFQRIKEINSQIDIPLVLHGASGLSEETIKQCIKSGINKINFATELRQAYTEGVREVLQDKKIYDPKVYQQAGGQKVFATVMSKMKLLNK